MSNTSSQIESLFDAAVGMSSDGRKAFLDRQCAAQQDLRRQLEGLLEAHDQVNHPIDRPAIQFGGLEVTCLKEAQAVGSIIAGRYKLLEQIGEGGMGTVWVAEQTAPVKRKVAIKVVKAGMDSKVVLARFEAERQALAMMDHPNIAKVLDGGMTEEGRPYFVMEYVKGVMITDYCDSVKLSIPERLNLFVQVCSAVQHAHQKGIIHRDLKPSNVLVAPFDDKAVPKVIDFGLAKALHQRLTERTLHTAHETVIGTPLYMSPEQAQLNNLDVDTRSDIYSLGVLLYELLTGTTPLEKARFKEAAWDEIRRIIREVEPPRPSMRLSSTGTLPSLAACRQTEPVTLTKQVKGELDWIVMKALEKERTRRYETATGLAKDVQRYLKREAVEACPPTLAYRIHKNYQKHQASILISGAFVALLFTGMLATTFFAINSRKLARLAREYAIEAQLHAAQAQENAQKETNARIETEGALKERDQILMIFRDVLEEFNPHKHPNDATIQEVLIRACQNLDNKTDITPVMKAKVRMEFGLFFSSLHEYQFANQQFAKASQEFEEELGENAEATVDALLQSGIALDVGRQSSDDLKRAEIILSDACNRNAIAKGESDITTIQMFGHLASCMFRQARFDDFLKLQRQRLDLALKNPEVGDEDLATAEIRLRLAGVLARSTNPKELAEAKLLCDQGIATLQRKQESNTDLKSKLLEAKILRLRVTHLRRNDAAFAQAHEQLVDQAVQQYSSEEREEVVEYYDGLAISSLEAGEVDIADKATRKLLKLAPIVFGQRSPIVKRHIVLRSEYLVQVKQFEQAEELLKQVLTSDEAKEDGTFTSGWDNFTMIRANEQYGICLRQRHDDSVALEHFEKALKLLEQRVETMGSFQNRHMVEDRRRILLSIRDLHMELGHSEKAAEAQVAIVEMQTILERILQ